MFSFVVYILNLCYISLILKVELVSFLLLYGKNIFILFILLETRVCFPNELKKQKTKLLVSFFGGCVVFVFLILCSVFSVSRWQFPGALESQFFRSTRLPRLSTCRLSPLYSPPRYIYIYIYLCICIKKSNLWQLSTVAKSPFTGVCGATLVVVEVKVPHPNNVKQIGVLTKKALERVINQTFDRLTPLSGLTNGCVFG